METEPTEVRLIARARAGDAVAFAELVRLHQATAFRVAYVVTRSAQDAEDATQTGFVKAWKAMNRFREGASFRPWILRIVRNEALNRIRSNARRERLQLRVLESEPSTGSAEVSAMAAFRYRAALDAIDALPDKLRAVVSCLYLLELSEAETASVLRIPRGTVKSRAARARAALQKDLADE